MSYEFLVLSSKKRNIIGAVSELYRWLDEQTQNLELSTQNSCNVCGNCCNFDLYGHRLYVTPPELIYFEAKIENRKSAIGNWNGRCPYQLDNKCTIHPHRFASCRIFFCKSNAEKQGELSEETLNKLKALCVEFGIHYQYVDLKTAMNSFRVS